MRSHSGAGRFRVPAVVFVAVMLGLVVTACLRSMAGNPSARSDFAVAQKIMVAEKCGSCHTLQGHGLDWSATIGPDLTDQASRGRSPAWLMQYLKDPKSIPADQLEEQFRAKRRLMPSFAHLSDTQLQAIVDFLASSRRPVS